MRRQLSPQEYLLIFLVLLVGLNLILPFGRIINPPYNWSGIFFVVFGIVINVWADNLFKIKKTTVKPDREPACLINSGPFSFSRHPMYLGMASILVGSWIVSGSLITLIFPIIFPVLIQKKFILKEEQTMESIFGDKYRYYKRKVRRWI